MAKQINVSLDDDFYDRLQAHAEYSDMCLTDYTRRSLRQMMRLIGAVQAGKSYRVDEHGIVHVQD